MSESAIQREICDYLTAIGAYWERTNAGTILLPGRAVQMGRRGTPDLHALLRGVAYYIETKAPKQGPTPIQLRVHARITRAGGVVIVARSVRDVHDGIRR